MHGAFAEYKRINPQDSGNDPLGAAIFRLDNGLTVYLSENHQTPHFYAEIAVRAGSVFDPPNATGLAHYMEHLLFKGSRDLGTIDYEKEKPYLDRITELYEEHFRAADPKKREEIYAEISAVSQKAARYAVPNEISKTYMSMGGSWLNAHTSFEHIAYKVRLPSNRLRQWAALESNRFLHPVFRLFQTELETVYEEKNRMLDDKYWIIQEAVLKKLFKHHPYGQQSLIGSVEHLKNPSLRLLYDYYDTYYVPGNMAIFISGAIDIQEAIKVIDEYFSVLKPGKTPRRPHWKEKPLKEIQRVEVQYLGEELVLLAFRVPGCKNRDLERLVIFDMLLGESQVGLINLNLVVPQKVRSAGSYLQVYNDYGMQFVWGVPKEGQTLQEVEALLIEQIDRIKNGAVDQKTIDDIVTNIMIDYKQGYESNDARVSMMRDSFVSFVSWKYWLGYLNRLSCVRKKDIIRAARKYFKNNYVAGYRRDAQHDIPLIQKPQIAPLDVSIQKQSAFARQLLAMRVDEIAPCYIRQGDDYRYKEDERGTRLYYVKNPMNDLFTFSIIIEEGLRDDNALGVAIDFLMKSGTASRSPQELRRAWFGLGCTFSMAVDDEQTIITISGSDENFETSLRLLMEVLRTPCADDKTLAEFKEIVRSNRRDMKKDVSTILSALQEFSLYGEGSRYLTMISLAALEEKSIDDLFGSIRNLLGYKFTMSYMGSLSFESVQRITQQSIDQKETLRDTPEHEPRVMRQADNDEVYFFDKQMAQTQIGVMIIGDVYDESLVGAGQLFNYYFGGGMSGVVFQELREARALAYSAWGFYDFAQKAKEHNIMRMGSATQADKTLEALGLMCFLIDDGALTQDRFSQAKESITNHYRVSRVQFRDIVSAVRGWKQLGLLSDPRQRRFQKVQEMQMNDVAAFHQKQIAQRKKHICIVGDKNKIDEDKLGEFGALRFVTLEDIFIDTFGGAKPHHLWWGQKRCLSINPE